jgi:16S rRNA processing protein RimM
VARRTKNLRQPSPASFRGAAEGREPGIQNESRSEHLDSGSGAAAPSRNDRVLVARFGAPHGVRGEVKLWSFTEDPLAVTEYAPLTAADGRTFEIESLRPAKDFLVARVAGVNDRTAAQALRNIELYVARERLPEIDEDETWYVSDLIGLAALAPDGAQVGTVTAVHNFGAGEVIEIAPAGGGPTIMLAFTESAVPEVNVKAGRMVVVLQSEGDDVACVGPDDLS